MWQRASLHDLEPVLHAHVVSALHARKGSMPRKIRKVVSKKSHVPKPVPDDTLVRVQRGLDAVLPWVLEGRPARATCARRHRGLRVGSACSGICAELQALQLLGVEHTACFTCEQEPHLRLLSRRMHAAHHEFEDCGSHSFLESPDCELFVSGFPCQAFSLAGSGHGLSDTRNGGHLMIWLCRWIFLHQPSCFLFENVPGLLQRHPATLYLLLSVLTAMKDDHGNQLYRVSWKILSCCEHGWIPQNRQRIFICGLKASVMQTPMQWPSPETRLISDLVGTSQLCNSRMLSVIAKVPMRPVQNYLSPHHGGDADLAALNASERRELLKVLQRLHQEGLNPAEEHYICDVSGSSGHAMLGKCPTLTKTRCGSGGFWITSRGRKTTTEEILRFQGMQVHTFPKGIVSDRQLRQAAGNSIPIPLLARVLQAVLQSTGRL